MTRAPKPTSFAGAAAFRDWLERRSQGVDELLVRCFKVHARHKGLTYREALDEALCFGWIDGVRHALDDDSFSVRFTPRRPKSVWSAVNIRRVCELAALGRMRAPGEAAFRAREEARSRVYSFESRPVELDAALARRMRANEAASAFFQAQPPGYRRTAAFWVMSAKREETRLRRLEALIASCARGRRNPVVLGGAASDDTPAPARPKPRSRRR